MKEVWLEKGHLIPEEKWIKLVDGLKGEGKIQLKDEAIKKLKEEFFSAIKNRAPKNKFGIFFSGGVDSTFIAAICKSLGLEFICYCVGFQEGTKEPEDITEAKKVAKELGLELKYKIFNLNEAEKIIEKTVCILKEVDKTDVVNIGVGAVVVAATELGAKDGVKEFFSGLGSEEIFAGYDRHSKAENVDKECWDGLKKMWGRDLVRDFNLAKPFGIKINTPFLDEQIIKLAMELPVEWKIDKDRKKIILREVAEEFLGEFAWRKKKAAQYGSCFDKAIAKLAKKEGLKLKKDYLQRVCQS